MNAEYLVKQLELLPHPEGGYYRETYRSQGKITTLGLPEDFNGDRNFATAIYFLIEKDNFSAFHKIKSDETWHFYAGDVLEVIEINEQGSLRTVLIGNNLEKGETFQYTVKANNWFASRVKSGGMYSLVGCTVAPGFDFADFVLGERNQLIMKFPEHQKLIIELTR